MSVQHLSINRLSSSKASGGPMILRPGQIVQGKIAKLYPDQKAQIQIGSQNMIAQLEASLAAGGKYHFQVQASDELIRLKVVGEQLPSNQTAGNVIHLLENLGMKAAKSNVALMQALIQDQIPFKKDQLQKAFTLLNRSTDKTQGQQVIKQMIAGGLPITDTIFQAVKSENMNQLTNEMKQLLETLRQNSNQTGLHRQLIDRMSQMAERPLMRSSTLTNQIETQASNDNQQLFQALKASGSIDISTDFTAWKTAWASFSAESEHNSTARLPFQLNTNDAIRQLEQLHGNGANIRKASQEILHSWGDTIRHAGVTHTPLSDHEFTQLKQQLSDKLLPLMRSDQQQVFIKHITNNPVSLQQLHSTLQTLADAETYAHLDKQLPAMSVSGSYIHLSPKESFLSQIQQVLQFTGLNHEYQIANNPAQQASQTQTIKSMLIQIVQQSDGVINEQSQQLLNFLNGMQIQSVQETPSVIQAALQVPGENLRLPDDMQLEFESRKTKDGSINPDYCRILFHLSLANLNETMIDMHIQKRAVAITVYNDQHDLTEKTAALKPTLKEGLEALDYQLSTITFKPFSQYTQSTHEKAKAAYQTSYQGVDYRI